jgi:hypothetical protein
MQSSSEPSGVRLPTRVIVSLRAGVLLALANVACAGIIAVAYMHAKAEPKMINVTGSAKKAIQSDLIVWTVSVSASDPDLVKAYDSLNSAAEKTLEYLRSKGIPDADVKPSSIRTVKHFVKTEKGLDTDKISGYELNESVVVSSLEVDKVRDVERNITTLLKEGILLESTPPRYLYTHLADLKIVMLAEATKDATTRAQQIATNSGATLGTIHDARMGVMQINALNSDDVSGSGVNDTSSFEKEITAIVSAKFSLK